MPVALHHIAVRLVLQHLRLQLLLVLRVYVLDSEDNVYTVDPGMTGYAWTVSDGGVITGGNGLNSIVVTWSGSGPQFVSVTYTDPVLGPLSAPIVFPVDVHLVDPTITGPEDPVTLLPAKLHSGITTGQVYYTEPGMSNYSWSVSPAGTIVSGQGTASITVDWTNPTGQQTVSVNYTDLLGCTADEPTILVINYYPFLDAIDPAIIPQFVDPLPHFAVRIES